MPDKDLPAQRSRAASWHWGVRAVLIATAVLLVAAAATFSVVAKDCTEATTGETTTGPAPTASPTAGGAPQPADATTPAATSKETETETCSRPGLTSVPVVALLLLAGLAVAPWLTKVTIGPVSAEFAGNPPVAAFSQESEGTGGAVDPVDAGKASAAEAFMEGVVLPGGWAQATLLFLLAPPDAALIAHKTAPGAADLDAAALEAELARVAEVVSAANAAPGQIIERIENGRTDLAYAAVNASKRVAAVLVATLSGRTDGPGGPAAGPAAGADAAVTGKLLAAGRGWSRIVIDVLLLDDDTKK
jgi:hypothetical protein